MLVALLRFSGSLATKCVFLNNKPWMIRPTFINLNPFQVNCYPFMIILDKCNGSHKAIDNLSAKICVPRKTKDVNVKVILCENKNKWTKPLGRHISCHCKCKFISTTCNLNSKME